jgi:DNA repair exonuclease SbcCD ATPase subunit
MSAWRERMNEMMTDLERERDELRVKLHLGKKELQEELEQLDSRLDALRSRAAEWADKADDQLDDVIGDAREKTSGWMSEIREGYGKLRERLSRDESPPPPPAS